MTELEYVRRWFPRIDERTAGYLLWNMTCYPMSMEETERQLNELRAEIRPQKRGWFRRLHVAARRIDREIMDALKQVTAQDAVRYQQTQAVVQAAGKE